MRFLYISIKDSASLGVPWNPGGITLPMLHKGSDTHSVWESQPRALAWYYHSHCLTNGFTNVRNVVSDINQPTAGNMEQVYRTWMRSEIKSAQQNSKWQIRSYTQAWWLWIPQSPYSAMPLEKRQGQSQEWSADMVADKVKAGGVGSRWLKAWEQCRRHRRL